MNAILSSCIIKAEVVWRAIRQESHTTRLPGFIFQNGPYTVRSIEPMVMMIHKFQGGGHHQEAMQHDNGLVHLWETILSGCPNKLVFPADIANG